MRDLARSLVLLLVSCGTRSSYDGPGGSDVDGAGATDALTRPVTTEVNCQPYVHTITYADGSRRVDTRRYGVVDSIGPDDEFTVETCGLTYTPTPAECPMGATCSGSVVPSGEQCYRTYRTGEYWDGKLFVYCGTKTEGYNASGTLIGTSGYAYASVRVIH